jgi:hypothetical protein
MLLQLKPVVSFAIIFFQFIQFNSRKSEDGVIELNKRLEPLTSFIGAIQEPYVQRGKPAEIKHGKVFSNDRNPRACIIVSRNIQAWAVPEFS